jgi:hypothetical protein
MIDNLFNEIMHKLEDYNRIAKIAGAKSATAIRLCHEIAGMQEAFRIVTGQSYADYLINKYGG